MKITDEGFKGIYRHVHVENDATDEAAREALDAGTCTDSEAPAQRVLLGTAAADRDRGARCRGPRLDGTPRGRPRAARARLRGCRSRAAFLFDWIPELPRDGLAGESLYAFAALSGLRASSAC